MPRPKPVVKTYGILINAVVNSPKFPQLTILVNGKPLDGGEVRVQELINSPVFESMKTFDEHPDTGTAGGQV